MTTSTWVYSVVSDLEAPLVRSCCATARSAPAVAASKRLSARQTPLELSRRREDEPPGLELTGGASAHRTGSAGPRSTRCMSTVHLHAKNRATLRVLCLWVPPRSQLAHLRASHSSFDPVYELFLESTLLANFSSKTTLSVKFLLDKTNGAKKRVEVANVFDNDAEKDIING